VRAFIVLGGFAVVAFILAEMKKSIDAVLGTLQGIRREMTECSESLNGLPHELYNIISGLHDITEVIDPGFHERRSKELVDNLQASVADLEKRPRPP
jgi:hypothetical protein